MKAVKIDSVKFVGIQRTMDITVNSKDHLYVANNLITSNSHAVAYSAITTAELWLKYNYPIEFLCSLINNTPQGKKKFGCDNVLALYVNYARSKGVAVHGPDVNISKSAFTIEGIGIRYGIEHVKNVANSSDTLMANAPFTDIKDLVERCKSKNRKLNKKVIESAIYSGALDKIPLASDTTFTDVDGILRRNVLLKEYYRLRKNKADEPVVDKTVEELEQLEVEMIGVCLSRKPLIEVYSGKINKNWHTIGNLPDGKSAFVFARIEDIQKRKSKKGNLMLVVSLSDDINTMEIFVFGESGINQFSMKCRKGSVAAIMTQQFEDSSTRFFSGHNPVIELVKY